MTKEEGTIEPYRILFPLGITSMLIGLLLWVLFQHRGISFYPRQAHANILFFAGFWSFVTGFMMTAIPKMTNTHQMEAKELFATVILIFMQISFSIRNQIHLAVAVFALQMLVLLIFLAKRFLVHKKIPFEGFYFLPFAFLQAILGVVLFYSGSTYDYSVLSALAGEAFLLNLIIGLGSRLIPVISRSPNALMPHETEFTDTQLLTFVIALILNIGFILDVIFKNPLGLILKFIILFIVSFSYFKLHKKPITFSIVAYGLKAGIIMLILSSLLAVVDGPSVTTSHLLYIGVFLLITLMIATRVMLAHGGQDINYEAKSRRLLLVFNLLVLSSIARYVADVNINGWYMKIAIYFCISALLIWSYKFVKILFAGK
jgi:uncharacterized protein involved in response to NO